MHTQQKPECQVLFLLLQQIKMNAFGGPLTTTKPTKKHHEQKTKTNRWNQAADIHVSDAAVTHSAGNSYAAADIEWVKQDTTEVNQFL